MKSIKILMAALFLFIAQLCAAQSLQPVYDAYFKLKDALVATNAADARQAAQTLGAAITAVQPDQLPAEARDGWQKAVKNLQAEVGKIAAASDIAKQRPAFATLSAGLYPVVKSAPANTPVYYQFCPMYNKGSYWLSKEQAVKNPFYGAQMLTCGSTKEAIK